MFDVFRISFLEYKKFFCKKSVYICLGLFFIFFLMSVDQLTKSNVSVNPVYLINMIFNGFMQFVLMFCAASLLPEEFRCGTSTFIFTSTKLRAQILLTKILFFTLYSITIGLMNFILITYYMTTKNLPIPFDNFAYMLVFYFIYSWFIGNYFLFFTVIFKSRAISFITGLFFLYFFSDCLLRLSQKMLVSTKILEFIPFYSVFQFLIGDSINANKIIGMLIGALIFFCLSAFIFEKQDL